MRQPWSSFDRSPSCQTRFRLDNAVSRTDARRSRSWRKSAAICALALIAPAGLAVKSFANARERLTIPTPFEVGESSSGNYLAAVVANGARDTHAASTFFREALRSDPGNEELVKRAFVSALANGNMAEAFPLANRVSAHDRNTGLAHLVLAVEAIKQHKLDKARKALERRARDRLYDITSTLLTAWTYADTKNARPSLSILDTLREDAFAAFRDYHGALIADLSGDKGEAEKRFNASYKNTLRLVDAYGRFLAAHADREDAKRVYKAFDDVAPGHPIVVAALADLDAGKPLQPFVRSIEEGAGEVLYGLGAVVGRQGDELASLIYLRLALYLAPNNALATIALADIYERMKQREAAIELYDSVPQDSPLRINADIQAALLLETLGKTKEASDHLQTMLAANPKQQEVLTALGNLQRSHKLFDESVSTYTRAIDGQPSPERSLWPLYYYRGIANEQRKNWPAAEADLKKALELFPDQPLVLNYLGYSWVERGLNLEDAFKMLRRAVDLRARDGYMADSLGWAYYRLGRYGEAVNELEKAIDLKPSDPVINDHLGDAYWRVGRKLEARFQWSHARDFNPDPDDLPKILEKIKNGLPAPSPGDKTKHDGG